jgi:hypothetical protein
MVGSESRRNGGSMSERIENLRTAIETMHKCKATHVQSVPVVEMFGNKTAWEGVVESFALSGHPKAKRCYAWSYQDKGETKYVKVLEIPPVTSPQTAVRVGILANNT